MAFNAQVSRPIQIEKAKWTRINPDIQRGIMGAYLNRRQAMDDFNVKRIDEKLDITAAPYDANRANDIKKNFYEELSGIQPRKPQDLNNAYDQFMKVRTEANTNPERDAINRRAQFYAGRTAEYDQVTDPDFRSLQRNYFNQASAQDVFQDESGQFNYTPGQDAPVTQMADFAGVVNNLVAQSKPKEQITEGEVSYMQGPNGELLGYTRKKGKIEKLPADRLYRNFKTAAESDPSLQGFYQAVDTIPGARDLYLGKLDQYLGARANLAKVDNESYTYTDNFLSGDDLKGGDTETSEMFDSLIEGDIQSVVSTKEGVETDPKAALKALNSGADLLSQYTTTIPGEVGSNGLIGDDKEVPLNELLDDPTGKWLQWEDGELNVNDIRSNLKGTNGEDLPMAQKEQVISSLSKLAILKRDKNKVIENMENSDEVQFAPGQIEPYIGKDVFFEAETTIEKAQILKDQYGIDADALITQKNKELYEELESGNQQGSYKSLKIPGNERQENASFTDLGPRHNFINKLYEEQLGVSQKYVKQVNEEYDKKYSKYIADSYTKRETLLGKDYSIEPTAKQLSSMNPQEQGTIALANRMQEELNKHLATEVQNYRVYDDQGNLMRTLEEGDDGLFLSADKEGGDPFKIEDVRTSIDTKELYYSDHLERHRLEAVLTTVDDKGNPTDKRIVFLEGDNVERLAMKADGKINQQQFRKQYVTAPLKDKNYLVKTFKPSELSDNNFGYIVNRTGPNTFNLVMHDRTDGKYNELKEENINEQDLSNILYNKYLYEIVKDSQFGAGGGSSAGK